MAKVIIGAKRSARSKQKRDLDTAVKQFEQQSQAARWEAVALLLKTVQELVNRVEQLETREVRS